MVDTNKKLPVNPGEDISQADARYLEIGLAADGRGYQVHAPGDFAEAKKSAFKEQWSSMGSYDTDQAHAEKGEVKTSLSKETRNYNTGGKSFTGEASVETYVQDTRKDTTEGDIAREVGGKEYSVVADQSILVSRNGFVHQQAAGNSSATSYIMSEGDIVEERSGGSFRSIEGDNILSVKENHVVIIGEGEYATHVQTGGWDTKVTKSAKLFSGTDLLIQSATKITLRVGTSSIVITPSNIEIIAQNSSGIIDLNPGGSGSGTGDPSETA